MGRIFQIKSGIVEGDKSVAAHKLESRISIGERQRQRGDARTEHINIRLDGREGGGGDSK